MADEDRDWNDEFKSMTDVMLTNDAQGQLEQHIMLARKWRARMADADMPSDLSDFIVQLVKEDVQRNRVLAAYGAALWRLMEADDG